MLAAERRQLILELLRRDGRVVAAELGDSLRVSRDTVRRDLQDLADAGLLQRVHGGALPPVTVSPTFRARQRDAPAAKVALARAAATLIRPGQVIILDAGTTNERLALELPPELEATIFTNAPPVAIALAAHPRVDVGIASPVGRPEQHDRVAHLGLQGSLRIAELEVHDPEDRHVPARLS